MDINHKTSSSSEEMFPVKNGDLNNLVKSNKRLVEKVVWDFTRNSKHVDKDDLIQEGFIALIEAAKSFSLTKNTRFRTHVYNRIKWKLLDYYKKPCNKKYASFNEEFEENESQDSYENEPKRKLKSETEKLCHEYEIQHKANIQRESVESAIEKLNPDEQLVIRARFYEEKTLEEIGESLGISYEGVRKREKKALGKLNFILRKD